MTQAKNYELPMIVDEEIAQLQASVRATPRYRAMEKREALIDRIHDLMETQNISRAELARRMDVTRGYITQLLGGNAKNFTLDTMVKLGEVFGQELHLEYRPSLSAAAPHTVAEAGHETAEASALSPLEPLRALSRLAWQTRIQVAKHTAPVTHIESHLQLVSIGSSNGKSGAGSEYPDAFTPDESCVPAQRVA